MAQDKVLNVSEDTKERAETLRRKLEASMDKDMTQDELVAYLLDRAIYDPDDAEYVPLEEVADDDADRSTEGPPPEGDPETYSGDTDAYTASDSDGPRWSGETYTGDENDG